MKIVCLIGPPPYLNHFVNEVSAKFNVELIIREATPLEKIGGKILKKGLINSARILRHKLLSNHAHVKDYNTILGRNWNDIEKKNCFKEIHNINDQWVIDELNRIKPDIVLVHGTSLIKPHILNNIPLTLNLHWGISPYYRGSYCTEWALINSDPLNIGYTIHKVTPKIDGGEILTQDRIVIEENDTANSINMKLTKFGTKKMIEVLTRLQEGEHLKFESQPTDVGFLYLTRHWNWNYQSLVKKIERSGIIKKMIAKPSRMAMKIKKW